VVVLVLTFVWQIDHIPKEWRDRLPSWGHQALLTRYARFNGGELHRAVMDLMLGYKENHGLEFPAIPAPPLSFLYIRDLALPRKLSWGVFLRGILTDRGNS
jgi:RNA polymerase I-specific transcription initiation factor RRN7